MKGLRLLLVLTPLLLTCQKNEPIPKPTQLDDVIFALEDYSSLSKQQVMVLGTSHFKQDVLEVDNQESLSQLIQQLASYQPTKIVVEWEPHRFTKTNQDYQRYLKDSFDISSKPNEVYQLGFRLAKQMNHDNIYLFDDQTEYIGSLEEFSIEGDPFSFELFGQYAEAADAGFYDQHVETITTNFETNKEYVSRLNLKDQITLFNSPRYQEINAQRMHMYEMRIGIQKNWSGPDWLGRWYRRNVRMMANVLKLAKEGDNILIIVGDNHKWFLDDLFRRTPDFTLHSSWELLYQGNYK